MDSINQLIVKAKADGRAASALIGGQTYYVWHNKQGHLRISCGRNRISLKNACAAIEAAKNNEIKTA